MSKTEKTVRRFPAGPRPDASPSPSHPPERRPGGLRSRRAAAVLMGLLAGLPTFISPPGPFIGPPPPAVAPTQPPAENAPYTLFCAQYPGFCDDGAGILPNPAALSDHYQPTEATVTLQNPDGEEHPLQLINFHPTADQPHFLGVYDPENPDALRLPLLKKEPTTGAVYGFENRVATFVYDPNNPGVAEFYHSGSGRWYQIPAENNDPLSSFLSQLSDKTPSLNYNEDIPFAVEVLSAKNTNKEVSSAVFAGVGFLSESEREEYLEAFFQNNSLGLLRVRKPNNLGYLSIPVVVPNTTDVDPITFSQDVTQLIPEANIRNLGYKLNKNAGEQIKFVYIQNDRIYAVTTTGELYDITDPLAQKITPPTLAFRSSFGFFVDKNGNIVATDRHVFNQIAEFNPEDNTWNEFDEDQWKQLATPEQQNKVTMKEIQEILDALKISLDQVEIIYDENRVARFAVVTKGDFALPDAKLYIDILTKYPWLPKWANEEGVPFIMQDPTDTLLLKGNVVATLVKFNNTNSLNDILEDCVDRECIATKSLMLTYFSPTKIPRNTLGIIIKVKNDNNDNNEASALFTLIHEPSWLLAERNQVGGNTEEVVLLNYKYVGEVFRALSNREKISKNDKRLFENWAIQACTNTTQYLDNTFYGGRLNQEQHFQQCKEAFNSGK